MLSRLFWKKSLTKKCAPHTFLVLSRGQSPHSGGEEPRFGSQDGLTERSGAMQKLPAGCRKLRAAGFSLGAPPEVSGAGWELPASRRNLQAADFTLQVAAGNVRRPLEGSGHLPEVQSAGFSIQAAAGSFREALEASGRPLERSVGRLLDPGRR